MRRLTIEGIACRRGSGSPPRATDSHKTPIGGDGAFAPYAGKRRAAGHRLCAPALVGAGAFGNEQRFRR